MAKAAELNGYPGPAHCIAARRAARASGNTAPRCAGDLRPHERCGETAQPPRSPHRLLVLRDWDCASVAIAHRRGDRLARKSAQRHSFLPARSQPPRLRLSSKRRDRTRRRRTRRSPQTEPRRPLFEHRSFEGLRIGGDAEDPRPIRSHLFHRATQGRSAGRMTAIRRSVFALHLLHWLRSRGRSGCRSRLSAIGGRRRERRRTRLRSKTWYIHTLRLWSWRSGWCCFLSTTDKCESRHQEYGCNWSQHWLILRR